MDLGDRPVSWLVGHLPPNVTNAFGGFGRATRRNAVAEPSKLDIDVRAYQRWEKAGRPEGREAEFWHLAEPELRNRDKASPTRTPDTL